jgi:hypothetical protein
MLHMKQIWRVMGPKVLGNIRQSARGFIAGGLHDLTVETREGLLHEFLPGVLIACLGRLLQENVVAHRLDPHQAQTARKRFILRQRHRFGGHLVRQTGTLLVAVRHDRVFHTTVDLLLGPIGGADKPIEARDPQEQTPQANPTGPHFGINEVERQHQPMQESEPGDTVKKRHDRGTLIKVLLVRPPCLKGTARNLKHLGRLTLGNALGVQIVIPRKQVSAFDTHPALVAILIATLLVLEWESKEAPCCLAAVGFIPALPHTGQAPFSASGVPTPVAYGIFAFLRCLPFTTAYCCPSSVRMPGMSRPLPPVAAFLCLPGRA